MAAAAAYGMLGENEALVANRKERSDADLEEVKAYRDRASAYQGKAEQLKAVSEPPPNLPSSRRSSHD